MLSGIAIPPLGCGHGGLSWAKVRSLIEKYLADSPARIVVFEPNDKVKEILQKQGVSKEAKLTDARAMLLYALAKYEERGEVANVFAANKIAYFLQESGEPLKLNFVPYIYGPYAQAVEKVLYALNGKYLSGLEQMNAKPFEPLHLKYENFSEVNEYVRTRLSSGQRERLSSVFALIQGFESTLSLEILSSIHYLLAQNKSLSSKELLDKIQSWNDRKKNLIKEEYVNMAVEHLQNYGRRLNFA
jgi:hypothetical protein